MGRIKDMYLAAHDELIAEYLLANPNTIEDEAYEATADAAYDRMQDTLEDIADRKHDEQRDRKAEEDHD